MSDNAELIFPVPDDLSVALEKLNAVEGCLTRLQKVQYWRLNQAQEAVLMVHRVLFVRVFGQLCEVSYLVDNLVSPLELIDSLHILVLRHGVLQGFKVVVASHN